MSNADVFVFLYFFMKKIIQLERLHSGSKLLLTYIVALATSIWALKGGLRIQYKYLHENLMC